MLPEVKIPPLAPFQNATVDEILSRIKSHKRGVRLALADEVGLGKTHVVAAIAARLVERESLVFYVAPSLEVAAQNGPKIAEACGKDPEAAKRSTSRLTLLPVRFPRAMGPHVISITPETSFNLSGPGNREERAFLFQIFLQARRRLRRSASDSIPSRAVLGSGQTLKWLEIFFRPKENLLGPKLRKDSTFLAWRKMAAGFQSEAKEVLKGLLEDREWAGEFGQMLEQLAKQNPKSEREAFKRTARLVSHFRLIVAQRVLTVTHRPELVFLDEWHKYHHHLRTETGRGRKPQLLQLALAKWNKTPSQAPKLCLLISATPFEISLSSIRESDELSGLGRLCQVLDPTLEKGAAVETRQRTFQNSWENYRDSLIEGNAPDIKTAREECVKSASEFSSFLSTFIIRTERPIASLKHADPFQHQGAWNKSALEILEKVAHKARDLESGTDVVALWSSSSHFPSMHDSYKLAEKLHQDGHGAAAIHALCPDSHWKQERLREEIRTRWGNGEKRLVPPLWIPPFRLGVKASPGKILIFSSWKAVPREVSFFLNDSDPALWSLRETKTSTPLGVFPTWKKDEEEDRDEVKTKHGWRIFYPSLCFDSNEQAEFARWLRKHFVRPWTAASSDRRRQGRDWARILVAFDYAFAEFSEPLARKEELLQAAQRRDQLLGTKIRANWRTVFSGLSGVQFAQLLREARFGLKWEDQPGIQLMQAITSCFAVEGSPAKGSLDVDAQEEILTAAKHCANYFNRDIAQRVIKSERRWQKGREYAREIIYYCRDHDWKMMIEQYLELLWHDYKTRKAPQSYQKVLADFSEALDIRAAVSGAAWWKGGSKRAKSVSTLIQPFIESRAGKATKGLPTDAEVSEEPGHKMSTTRRRKAFNSPFLPHVLVSTSIGQEGVDFHRYCDTVVHWSPPESPLALEQREGRVDRFKSYQVRRFLSENPGEERKEPDPSGMSPNFCIVDSKNQRSNQTERRVWVLPFSREAHTWRRCMERLHYFRLFLGAPDPAALEAELQGKLSELSEPRRHKVLEALAGIRIVLRPKGSETRTEEIP